MNKLGFYNENGFALQGEEKHIIENVERVLLTRRGERVCDLSFGSDLRKYLFMPEISIPDVISEIKNAVKRCEPNAEVLDCILKGYDKNEGVLDLELIIKIKKSGRIIETGLKI